jgi:hypothetical protein
MQDCEYTDGVGFVEFACVRFDFDFGPDEVAGAKGVGDRFLLLYQTELFMEEARVLCLKNYCRILLR